LHENNNNTLANGMYMYPIDIYMYMFQTSEVTTFWL